MMRGLCKWDFGKPQEKHLTTQFSTWIIFYAFFIPNISHICKNRERKMRLQNEWDGPRQIFYIDLVFFLTEKLVKIEHTTLKLGQEGYKRVVAYSISHSEVPTNQSQSWKKIANAPKKPKVRRLSNLYIWTYEGHERDRSITMWMWVCMCVRMEVTARLSE